MILLELPNGSLKTITRDEAVCFRKSNGEGYPAGTRLMLTDSHTVVKCGKCSALNFWSRNKCNGCGEHID